MPDPVKVQIQGLRELQRELAKIDDGAMKKRLSQASKGAAKEVLVPRMQKNAPRRSGDLGKAVRALSTSTRTRIAVGTNVKVPYAGPINFGWPSRGIRSQEFIYRTIVEEQEAFLEKYWGAIDTLVSRAFPRGKL